MSILQKKKQIENVLCIFSKYNNTLTNLFPPHYRPVFSRFSIYNPIELPHVHNILKNSNIKELLLKATITKLSGMTR